MQDNRKREIRSKADSFRVKCRVSRYGIIDLFKECERLEYKLFRYPLGENADLGFTVKKDDDIIQKKCIKRQGFNKKSKILHSFFIDTWVDEKKV